MRTLLHHPCLPRAAAALAVALLSGIHLRPAAAQVPPPACALLDDPEVQASISGAGETALRVRCGDLAPASTGEKPVLESLGNDLLVNDRSTDAWSNVTQSETSVASSGSTVLVGFNDSGEYAPNGDFTGYARSTDGGASFTDMRTPATPLGDVDAVFGDPVLAADLARAGGQTAVFYFSNLAVDADERSIIGVHKSVDGGLTWVSAANASPSGAPEEFQDKEWLAVDTRTIGLGAGNVYVCWRRFGGAGGIQLSRSTDGGATFTQLPASLSANAAVQGCQVAVSPVSGTVLVAWTDFSASPPTVRLRRSVDAGETFEPELTVGTAPLAETVVGCGFGAFRPAFVDREPGFRTRAIRSAPFSSLDVDPVSGAVVLAWHRAGLAGGALADVAFSRSTDDGASFSSPTRVNADVGGQQFFPSIAANSAGALRVIYYSTQNSPTDRTLDVYAASSSDLGATWSSPVRVTDTSFDRPVTNPNFDSLIAFCYMGDYVDVSAPAPGLGGATFYLAWGDNRLDANAVRLGVQPDPDIRFDTD